MKKSLVLWILLLLAISGCGKKNFDEEYNNMQIGSIDSYQLDLRIYGEENVNFRIDNYKNESYRVDTSDATYYVINNSTYKEIIGDEIKYVMVDTKLFTNTDILLQGLKNIKSRKEVKNDITDLDLESYDVTFDSKYIKSLLNELAYDSNYNNAKGKIYIKDNNIYKIIYEIDDLTITATFFRINNIRKPDIGL